MVRFRTTPPLQSSPVPLRIGLNLLHALPQVGGVWNYIGELLAALAAWDPQNEYVGFVTAISAPLLPTAPNFHPCRVELDPHSRPRRVFFENTVLPLLAQRFHIDCLHWFGNTLGLANLVPGVVTVYDPQSFRNFDRFSPAKRLYQQVGMKTAARRAQRLLPISEATATELIRCLHVGRHRLTVIPAVLTERWRPACPGAVAALRKRYDLPKRFWVYVAHFTAHKNHARLCRVYRRLRDEKPGTWELVLRGDEKPGGVPLAEVLAAEGLERQVRLLPRLEDDEMPALYTAASGLVFPSLFEGAGLPVLEAMACGCPVVASDIPALREAAGNAVSYFDPTDEEDLFRAMAALQDDPATPAGSRRRTQARLHRYRAATILPRLLSVYREAARGRSPA